jgi:hypothetical protein
MPNLDTHGSFVTRRSWPVGRRTAVAVLLGLAWIAVVADVAAHDGIPDLRVSPTTVAAGGDVTVAGDDFTTGDSLAFVLVGNGARVPIGEAVVGRNGHVSVDVVVPDGTVDGAYVIEADRGAEPLASVGLTVGAAAVGGTEIVGVIAVAAVAGVGAGLYLARRNRGRAPVETPETTEGPIEA